MRAVQAHPADAFQVFLGELRHAHGHGLPSRDRIAPIARTARPESMTPMAINWISRPVMGASQPERAVLDFRREAAQDAAQGEVEPLR